MTRKAERFTETLANAGPQSMAEYRGIAGGKSLGEMRGEPATEEHPMTDKPNGEDQPTLGGNITGLKIELQNLSQRMNHLLDDRDAINADIKEIRKEVKDKGIDPNAFNRAISDSRAEDKAKITAYYESLDVCREALGLLADTPLGDAAMPHVTVSVGRSQENGQTPE